jgi:hypothetical protein
LQLKKANKTEIFTEEELNGMSKDNMHRILGRRKADPIGHTRAKDFTICSDCDPYKHQAKECLSDCFVESGEICFPLFFFFSLFSFWAD